MQIYKQGHGIMVRRTAFVTLAAMTVWGGMTLYGWLIRIDALRTTRLVDYRIPLLDQYIDPAFIISWVVVAIACRQLFRFLNRERQAEFLIDTDSEFRKVTWPNWNDALNAALVVLVFVVVMTGYIAICDTVMTQVLRWIL